jgi:hypothetical protein
MFIAIDTDTAMVDDTGRAMTAFPGFRPAS